MPKLTAALLSSLIPDAVDAKSITLSKQLLTHIEDISFCVNMTKLDLSENSLEGAECLSGLRHCRSLSWLNLSKNGLVGIQHVTMMAKLTVLNVSHNNLNSLPSTLNRLSNLRAFIANNNGLKMVDVADLPTSLNTLILSHNALQEFDFQAVLLRCKSLTKLNLSHNQLHALDLKPVLTAKGAPLRELRANDNRLSTVAHLPLTLEILDLGNNASLADLHPISDDFLPRCKNLNIRGTLIHDKYAKSGKYLLVFNGKRVMPKKGLQRKPKGTTKQN